MAYRDFAQATAVFDGRGRRGLLVFDEDPDEPPTIGDCSGWVAFDVPKGRPRFERLSVRTTWEHARAVIGLLYDGSYRGPSIPRGYPAAAADLDLIRAKLSAAGLRT